MDDRPPPDTLEKCLRFGCGSLFGGAVLLAVFARYCCIDASPFWIGIGLGSLICGLFAIRYGDRFYPAIVALFRWW